MAYIPLEGSGWALGVEDGNIYLVEMGDDNDTEFVSNFLNCDSPYAYISSSLHFVSKAVHRHKLPTTYGIGTRSRMIDQQTMEFLHPTIHSIETN